MVRTECNGCRFRAAFELPPMPYCGYSLITGHTKLGLPQRADGLCPAYDAGEKEKGESFASREVTAPKKRKKAKYPHDQMLQLWEHGMVDREIAEQIGCAKVTVSTWRKGRGLPSQRERKRNENVHQLAAGQEPRSP